MLIDADHVKQLFERFTSSASSFRRISSNYEPIRTRVQESSNNASEILQPEIDRFKKELAKAENYDSHFYRSHLLQYQSSYKDRVDKPNSLIRKFDSLFGHLDEIFKVGSHRASLEKLQIEIQAVSDDLGSIQDILFDRKEPLLKEAAVNDLYDVFHDLNGIFMNIYERLDSKGLAAFIRPRKVVLDALAEHNKFQFHRSKFNSPEDISLGFISSVAYQYLKVANPNLILPNINFTHPMTSGFVRVMQADQKNLFPHLKRDLAESDFEALSKKYDLRLREAEYKSMMSDPGEFGIYVDRELGDLATKASYTEIERAVRRTLVLDALLQLKALEVDGLDLNFTNYAKRIDAKTNNQAESPLRKTLSRITAISVYRNEATLNNLLYKAAQEEGVSDKTCIHAMDLYKEAKKSMNAGHFVSWDDAKQAKSDDEVLENQFKYFQENIFEQIQEKFSARHADQRVADVLDQAFKKFSRRPFNSLMNQITQDALKVGVSKPDLLQFRYIATRLFRDYRAMHNQDTAFNTLKRRLVQASVFV